jgi:hypothetical protein
MVQSEKVNACPCLRFRAIENAVEALESPETTRLLISWLSGESESFCGTYSCNNRVETSLVLLNAVRDACRPFLEDANNKQTTPSYEESFPALSLKSKQATTLTTKSSSQGGNKRRIRPATFTPASNASLWGVSKGNLVDLQSEEPLDVPIQQQFAKAFAPRPGSSASSNVLGRCTSAPVTPEKSGTFKWKDDRDRPLQPTFTPEKNEGLPEVIALKNLVAVYSALIDSCLVPSTPLELHLLFRLLVLPSETKNGLSSKSPLGHILVDNSSCIYFASESIRCQEKILHGLGPVMWETLARCPPLLELVPSVYNECDRLLKAWDRNVMLPSSFKSNQTALLSLPFDEQRDSRHNFRSPEEQLLYMNREASRDAFLYQLRSFLSVRGKVLDASKVEKSLLSIQRSSRSVIEGLMETNHTWFSSLFVDLLLQIGLVPLQETDKELLQIADKDKLQKLHQRFSQSASQSRSSSHKVAADPARSTNSPRSEALHMFPGHQEFFFLFILSADSYTFAIHLRSAIINKMTKIIDEDASSETKLLEMCMLARYVGLLFFSPNWRSFGTTTEHLSADPALDALLQLKGCGLCVISVFESALLNNKLHLIVPWIIELLQMSSWDISAMKSKIYVKVLSILRQLQKAKAKEASDVSGCHLSLAVESFFANAVGVAAASKLAPCSLPAMSTERKKDDISATIPPNALFSSIAHLDDLRSLVSSISRTSNKSTKSPGVSRKLRPSILSHVTSSSPRNVKALEEYPRPEDKMKTNLRDGFFHRQPEMKLICEFVVSRLLKKSPVEDFQRKIEEEMRSRCPSGSADDFRDDLLVACCNDVLRKWLGEHLKHALELLSPVQLDRRVLTVATSLGVEHGLEQSGSMFQQIIASQRELWMEVEASAGKELFATDLKSSNRNDAAPLVEHCIDAVNKLSGVLSKSLSIDQTMPLMDEVRKAFQLLSGKSGKEIPPEENLRMLFVAVFELDKSSSNVLSYALASDESAENRWRIVSSYLLLAAEIQSWSHHGLSALKRRCAEVRTLGTIISLGISTSSSSQVADLSARVIETKVWKTALVEDSLRKLSTEGCEGAPHILAAHQKNRSRQRS